METLSNLAFVGTSVPILRYSSTNLAVHRLPYSPFHSKPKVYSKAKVSMSLGFQFNIPGATPEDYKVLNSATSMKEIQERLRAIQQRLTAYKTTTETDKVTDSYFDSLRKMTEEMKEEMLGGGKKEESNQEPSMKVEAPQKQENQPQAPPVPEAQQLKKQEQQPQQQQAKDDQKVSDLNMDELWGLDEDAEDPNFTGDAPKETYESDGDEEFDEQKLKEYEEYVRQQAKALKEEREQQKEMERKMAERRKAAMEQAMAARRAAQDQEAREETEQGATLEAQANAAANAEKAKQQEAARQTTQQAQQHQQASHAKGNAEQAAQFAKDTAQTYAADIAKEMAKKRDRETKSFKDFEKEATKFVDQDEFGNATTKFDMGNRVPLSPRAIRILSDPNVSLEETYEVLRVEMKEFQDERRKANPDAHRRNVNDYFAAMNNPAVRAEPKQVEITTTFTEIVAPPAPVHIDRYNEAASQQQAARTEPARAAQQYSAPTPVVPHTEASLISHMFAELQSFNVKKAALEREHQIRIMQILEKYSH